MVRKRYFEWIDGDNKGDVVSLVSISEIDGEVFYNFDDEDSCNLRFISKMTENIVDLKGKFMVEVENPYNIWTFAEIDTDSPRNIKEDMSESKVPTLHDILHSTQGGEVADSDLGKEKLVPPRKKQAIRPLPNKEDYKEKPVELVEPVVEKKVVPKEEPIQVVEEAKEEVKKVEVKKETKKDSVDPVAILVDSCKKHSTEIPLTLTINLPMRSLYDIASNEFDNGGEKFINYIVDGIDPSMIIDALKSALMEAYSCDKNEDDKNNQ